MSKKMLIDAAHREEIRVAVLNDKNQLEELDFETTTKPTLKGNVYLAKITRVEPSLQAAFVEYGGNRHGFLPFGEIHPDYFRIPIDDRQKIEAEIKATEKGPEEDKKDSSKNENADLPAAVEDPSDDEDAVDSIGGEGTEEFHSRRGKKLTFHDRYKIQEVLQKNQVLLIQVVKEERQGKGAALTTYLSFAGRYCVLMPNAASSGGVSRKITSIQDRRRLKDALNSFKIPDSMSLIIRTAGKGLTKPELKRDYDYLMRLWSKIREVTLESVAPALIYEEANLIKRAIRDLYSKDTGEVWIQGKDSYKATKSLFKEMMPAHEKRVKEYDAKQEPIFQKFRIEEQVQKLHKPEVTLPSGGSIVFNQTEALVAIDINSGKSTRERHINKTALNTNLEAATEIARQLRLRDLAGLVVIDFIDMEEAGANEQVEARLREGLNQDRARIQMGRISPFGLLECSRQRLRPSITEISSVRCPHCTGTGMMRSLESYALDLLHTIETYAIRGQHEVMTFLASSSTVNYLLNYKRAEISTLEQFHKVKIFLEGQADLLPPQYELMTGNLQPGGRREGHKKKAQNTHGQHMDRMKKFQAPPLRDGQLDVEMAPEVEQKPDPAVNDKDSQDDDRGPRRRGRRGGRRRGGRQNQGQNRGNNNPNRNQAAAAGSSAPKKSWWQRLLD